MAEESTQVEVEPNLRRRNPRSILWEEQQQTPLPPLPLLLPSGWVRQQTPLPPLPLLLPSGWVRQQPPPLLSPSDRAEQQPPPPPLLSPSDREEQQEEEQQPPLLPPPLLSPSDREEQQPLPPCGVVVNQIKFITVLVAETCTGIAVHFTPIDHIEEQQQRCAEYSQKALQFAISMFFAYVGAPSASSTNTTFKIAMAAFFVAVPSDLISVTRAPKWGRLLTCLSWFLLVLLSYLLLVSFNKKYSYVILPLSIPIVIGLLQYKLWPAAFQQIVTDIEAGQGLNSSDEAGQAMNNNSIADKDLDDIFKLSAGIVTYGSFVSMIIAHYTTGLSKTTAVNPAVFFFFTVALGLYLMMVTTVRIAALTLHARHLSYLLMLLLLSTLIATLKAWESGSDSHV